MRIAEDCGDKTLVALDNIEFGTSPQLSRQIPRRVLKGLERGLRIASEIRNREIEGYISNGNWSRLPQGPAGTSMAADYLESALTIGDQARKPRIQQEALAELGSVYLAWGKSREAADYFEKTLDRARRYGEKRRETSALFSQGEVYAKWGRYSDALVCFRKRPHYGEIDRYCPAGNANSCGHGHGVQLTGAIS